MKISALACFIRKSFISYSLYSCSLLTALVLSQSALAAPNSVQNQDANAYMSAPKTPQHNFYNEALDNNDELDIPAPSSQSKNSHNNSNFTTSSYNEKDAEYIDMRLGFKHVDSKVFSNLLEADKIYENIPRDKFAFYLDRPADRKMMWDKYFNILKDVDGQIGVAVFGPEGLLMLANNTNFPLQGLSQFHLGYAVSSTAMFRNEDATKLVYFNTKDLKKDVYSPMTELVMQSFSASVENNNMYKGGGVQARARALANVTKTLQAGNLKDLPKSKELADPTKAGVMTVEELSTIGKVFSFELADLFYYALGFNDLNASDILLSYLGSIESLDSFCKEKGLRNTNFVYKNADVWDNPSLGYKNSGPLYETAKLMASYTQDTMLNKSFKDSIDNIMFFDAEGQNLIQDGVKQSISADFPDEKATLKIFSHSGMGRMNSHGRRMAVSDMALIEYKGRSYVMVISVKNLKGTENNTIPMGQRVISQMAQEIFSYIKARDF